MLAVVGTACRLPGGADTPELYWDLLVDGVDAIRNVPHDRWNHQNFTHPNPGVAERTPATQAGFLNDVFDFDAGFFGISPREAESMDPQHRLLLELAYEVFERAGYPLAGLAGSDTAVFAALSSYDMYHDPGAFGSATYTASGASPAMAANRISYAFDLRGPSLTVDSACSASLSALDLAGRSLSSGQCKMALVASVNLMIDPALFLAFSRLGMLSPSNRCHAFDAAADGFVRGEGGVVLLLKTLASALADGDTIEAVVRSTQLAQDGRSEGITVPNQQAQEALLAGLYRDDELRRRVFAIETHGTGTAVGDPIEAKAIAGVFTDAPRPLWLGSAKTNIGHLEGAAGAASLLKAILALKHGLFPGNLHFRRPPAHLDLQAMGLAVPTQVQAMPSNAVLGVSSFGFGGSIGHAVLEAAPPAKNPKPAPSRLSLLLLSGRSPAALASRVAQFRRLFQDPLQGPSLADIVYTAACRSTHHRYRATFVGSRSRDLETALARWSPERASGPGGMDQGPVFVFCGQGSQWLGMGRQLIEEQPVFAEVIERCDQALQGLGQWSLLDVLTSRGQDDSRLQQTEYAQPAIFAVQAGLVELWKSWGVRPSAVVGHSVGEVAAAFASGVFSLEEALGVIFHRAQTMSFSGEGRMVSVQATPEQVANWLAQSGQGLEIGAVNGPHAVVVSGAPNNVDAFQRWLTELGVACRPVPVQYAFHSGLMDPVEQPLKERLVGLTPRRASVPLISTVTGQQVDGSEMDADYWWRNVRRSVQFAAAFDVLLEAGHQLFLEMGPHPVLSSACADCADARHRQIVTVASLRRNSDQSDDLLKALGRLWELGQVIEGAALYAGGKKALLPGYPWQRQTYRPAGRERRRGLFAESPYSLLGVRSDHSLPTWKALGQPEFASWELKAGHLLELVLEAVDSTSDQAQQLDQVCFHRMPGSFALADPVELQTCLDQASGYVWVSAKQEPGWFELVRGRMAPRVSTANDPEWKSESGGQQITLRQQAEVWGYRCDGNERLVREGANLCLEIDWPAPSDDDALCHPESLTKLLLGALAFHEPSLLEAVRKPFLAQIERVCFYRRPLGRVRACYRLEESSEAGWRSSLRGYDGESLWLELQGMQWTWGPERQAAPLADNLMLEAQWSACPLSESGRQANVTATVAGPGSWRLEGRFAHGQQVTLFVADGSSPLSQLETMGQLLSQAEAKEDRSRWVLVTFGAQKASDDDSEVCLNQAPLLGFWRTLQIEHPGLRPLMIDLPGQPEEVDWSCLEGLLLLEHSENEMAVRQGQALSIRWRRVSLSLLTARTPAPFLGQPVWRADATYLVSGGLSGLGAAVARWLAQAGVGQLLLVGRRGLDTPGSSSLVADLEQLGARVRVCAADVAEFEEGDLADLSPLAGIFHTANHMEDTIILGLDKGKLERVFRAKADGAWRLHQLSLRHPVEHFVLFSSISSCFGAAGQANYAAANAYLDALAWHRRLLGLSALAVNWGPFEDVGYLQRHPDVLDMLRVQGYEPLRSGQCLSLLGRLMALQSGSLVVAGADWQKLDRGPRLALLGQASATQQESDQTVDFSSVLDFLSDCAQRILRLPDTAQHQGHSLRELGLDSVMAVEFRNAIESRFGITMPVQSVLRGPSLRELGELIVRLLETKVAPSPVLLPHLDDDEVRQLLAHLESHDSASSLPPDGT